MNLPTEEQCLDYFDQFKVPLNIRNHCLKVRDVAVFLAQELKKKDIPINVGFVGSLALFHDLFKMVALENLELSKFHNHTFSNEEIKMREDLRKKYPGKYECEVAHEVLKDEFPELALSLLKVSNHENKNHTWEELVVHYADWRVFRERVVPLEERYTYLQERYPREGNTWELRRLKIKKKEQEIFSRINLKPEELKQEMENAR